MCGAGGTSQFPGGPGTNNMTPRETRGKQARRRIDSDSGLSPQFWPTGWLRPGLEMGPPPVSINCIGGGVSFVLAISRRRKELITYYSPPV